MDCQLSAVRAAVAESATTGGDVIASNFGEQISGVSESKSNKKLSYCWETVRRESMPRIAEMDVEMTT